MRPNNVEQSTHSPSIEVALFPIRGTDYSISTANFAWGRTNTMKYAASNRLCKKLLSTNSSGPEGPESYKKPIPCDNIITKV